MPTKPIHHAIIALILSMAAMTAGCDLAGEKSGPKVTVYKDPDCGCCSLWEAHLRANGFEVESKPTTAMGEVKARLGVPPGMGSCHTATIGSLVIEGHVPAAVIERTLSDASSLPAGLAVPGMPAGSPGMEMPSGEQTPYQVFAFDADGGIRAVANYPRPR